jgi:hypothetical protein
LEIKLQRTNQFERGIRGTWFQTHFCNIYDVSCISSSCFRWTVLALIRLETNALSNSATVIKSAAELLCAAVLMGPLPHEDSHHRKICFSEGAASQISVAAAYAARTRHSPSAYYGAVPKEKRCGNNKQKGGSIFKRNPAQVISYNIPLHSVWYPERRFCPWRKRSTKQNTRNG